MTKPLILITNDDGVLSPGLLTVAEAVESVGDLVIAAPRFQQTSMGRSFPRSDMGGVIETLEMQVNGKTLPAYGVHGSPAMAVSHGILEISPRQPDLVISGVNYGENIGFSITASGTLGAAFQASGFGIPSLAISLQTPVDMHNGAEYGKVNWDAARYFTRHFTEKALQEGFAPNIATWNINIPADATPDTPIKKTHVSRQNYYVVIKPERTDWSVPYHVQAKQWYDPATLEPDSDIYAFCVEHKVTVTPIGWHFAGLS
ncbi:MAG: 5'/3'-nucleotidase SurE [Anaerolineae bacterium]|nr:5'/3'-nucleotidase SurE [Anaerolineae bacterium]